MSLKALDQQEFLEVIAAASNGLENLLIAFSQFLGEMNWGRQQVILDVINESLNRKLTRQELFGCHGEIQRNLFERYCVNNKYPYLKPVVDDPKDHTTVLGPGANEWLDFSLPQPMNMRIGLETRPAYDIEQLHDVSLFVAPFGYQAYCNKRECYWPYASSRALGIAVNTHPEFEISRPVVVCQDQFDAGNNAHFLYDSVPRIIAFCETLPDVASDALFIFGGVRSPAHQFFLARLSARYGLSDEQFFFPPGKMNIRSVRQLFYFSDQQRNIVHPLNMCHEYFSMSVRSLGIVDKKLEGSKKLYISRADAGNRRLLNEAIISRELERRGFVSIIMSSYSVEEQICLLSNASEIVAPHGMGLTYLLFNTNPDTKIVEIFHPKIGSDAYAFVAKASGLNYRYVIGCDGHEFGTDYQVPTEILFKSVDNK